jgi:hypothetical protein
MPKRDKLFQLVRSLSKTEKRYFSIYAQLHAKSENNDYLKLFREFERQETLDESRIKHNLEGERLLDHYAVTKSYLYDLILKAMRSYSKHSEDKRVLDFIQDVEFLASKGIFDQALQLLNKAREIASEHGLLASLDLLLHWEKRIHMASGFVYFDEEKLTNLGGVQLQLQLKRRMQNRLWRKNAMAFGGQMGRLYSDDPLQGLNSEEESALKLLSAHPRNELPSFFIEVERLISEGKVEDALNQLEQIQLAWEASTHVLEFPFLYLRICRVRFQILFDLGRFKKLDTEIERVASNETLVTLNDYISAWARSVSLYYSGYKAILQRDEFGLRQFVLSWERRPILDQLYVLGYETNATFFTGYSAYLRGKWEDAEQEFAKICRNPEDWPNLPTLYGAWIYRLICHFKMGSWKKIIRVSGRFKERLDGDGIAHIHDIKNGLEELSACLSGADVLKSFPRLLKIKMDFNFSKQASCSLFNLSIEDLKSLDLEEIRPQDWK